jgi:peptide/nickel transport system substrate-binding protein
MNVHTAPRASRSCDGFVRRLLLPAVVASTIGLGAGCFERGGSDRPARSASDELPITDGGWRVHDLEPNRGIDDAATIRIALEAEPATLDPFASLDAISARVLAPVLEGLVCATATGAIEPCVAASVQASADRRTWRFALDRSRHFSDGSAVTVSDVIASFEAARGHGHAIGPLASVVDDLTAVQAIGDDQVVLRFATDRWDRLRELALIPIIAAAQLSSPTLATAPVGTGPFAVASWTRGESLRLSRVAAAVRRAGAQTVEFVVVVDRVDAIRRLTAGTVDVVLQVPIDLAIATTGAHPGFVRFRYSQPAYLAAIYNCRRPALSDAAVRRALTAVLDRRGIARTVLGGATTLTGPWLPDDPNYDSGVAAIEFDPRGPTRSGAPTVTVLVPAGSTSTARIADIWSADARGRFDLRVETVPFAQLLARLAASDFDIAITSLSAGPEVDPGSRLASDAPAEQAWPGLRDVTLDQLLAHWRIETNDAVRVELGHAIHRRVDLLAPMAFIAVDTRAGLARADLGGLIGTDRGLPPMWRWWKSAP